MPNAAQRLNTMELSLSEIGRPLAESEVTDRILEVCEGKRVESEMTSRMQRLAGLEFWDHKFKMRPCRASLVVQWLRIDLPMQGTQVRALVREDPTCLGATKPVHHNY